MSEKPWELVVPQAGFESEWKEVVAEMRTAEADITPYALHRGSSDYADFLMWTHRFSMGIDLPPGKVASDLFFLCRRGEKRIIGAVDIRHELNEYLLQFGGHIGYGIRPSERRKGYATKLLSMALDYCQILGLSKVLVTCDETNIGSRRTIEKNGGILENTVQDGNERVLRFWIYLDGKHHLFEK